MNNLFLRIISVFIFFTSLDDISAQTKNRSSVSKNEPFFLFFSKFKGDSIFQQERIINPISVVVSDDDDGLLEKKMNIKFVSFDKSDWKKDPVINFKRISLFRMVVILQLEDTGMYISHYFKRIKGKWFLVKIVDSST